MAAAVDIEKAAPGVEASADCPAPGPESETATPLKNDDDAVDGWRGWVVVAASSCSVFCYMGVIYSWGILQAKIAEQTSLSLTSLTFVGSLATSFMASVSILVGKAIRRFGYRKTAFAGAFLLGLGEFLSSWVVDRLGALFFTHGILFGVGGSLTILVCPDFHVPLPVLTGPAP